MESTRRMRSICFRAAIYGHDLEVDKDIASIMMGVNRVHKSSCQPPHRYALVCLFLCIGSLVCRLVELSPET